MPEIGDKLADKYRLIKLMGRGGMGSVYEAEHEELSKRVAIKFLNPGLGEDGAGASRFKREARAAAATGHRSIVDIYDIGSAEDGSIFLVMELLKGESMGQLLAKKGTLEVTTAAYIVSEVLSALHAAHEAGIVHRDIKPDNIFLVKTGKALPDVKLLDFGASQMVDPAHPDERLTKSGVIFGTPYYMSPEQASGDKDIDRRTDVYAVGVVLYEALTGEAPFKADNLLALMRRILDAPLVAPSELNPGIPEAFEAVILKAMARDREARYATASEMLADLLPFVDDAATSHISIPDDMSKLPKTLAVDTDGWRSVSGEDDTEAAQIARERKAPDTAMAWTGEASDEPAEPRGSRRSLGVAVVAFVALAVAVAVMLAWPSDPGSPASTSEPAGRSVEPSVVTPEANPGVQSAPPGAEVGTHPSVDSGVDGASADGGLGDARPAAETGERHTSPTHEKAHRTQRPKTRPGSSTRPAPEKNEGRDAGRQETPPQPQGTQGNPQLRQEFQL